MGATRKRPWSVASHELEQTVSFNDSLVIFSLGGATGGVFIDLGALPAIYFSEVHEAEDERSAVFRNGTWYLLQSTGGIAIRQFGLTADKPVPSAFLP